jgi:hypothetical protein
MQRKPDDIDAASWAKRRHFFTAARHALRIMAARSDALLIEVKTLPMTRR